MPALCTQNSLVATVLSDGTDMLVTQNRMIASDVWLMEDAGSIDSSFALLILDENGQPILDVNGQYLIGG